MKTSTGMKIGGKIVNKPFYTDAKIKKKSKKIDKSMFIEPIDIELEYEKILKFTTIKDFLISCDDDLDLNRFGIYYLNNHLNKMSSIKSKTCLGEDCDIEKTIDNLKTLKDQRINFLKESMQDIYKNDFSSYLIILEKVFKWFINLGKRLYDGVTREEGSEKYEHGHYIHWVICYDWLNHVRGQCLGIFLICLMPYLKEEKKNILVEKCMLDAMEFKDMQSILYFLKNKYQFFTVFYILRNIDMGNIENNQKFKFITQELIEIDTIKKGHTRDFLKMYFDSKDWNATELCKRNCFLINK